ncbi:pantoate--beta-alanine ligase [bacterium]|nr:pantoate--beta-alanine ligase [bacterium]
MEIIKDPAAFQKQSQAWRAEGLRVALVPTMGALHAGHFKLIECARQMADRVSVSIFLNPIQFGPNEDLAKYPKTFEADAAGCRERGVDAIFAPVPGDVYPPGFQTTVHVDGLTSPLCGRSRPGHFDGVTTVVLKLLLLGQPSVALFGWKDAQQLLVIRRMARDLNVPVEIMGIEIVREADGLAMSSRNVYLKPEERREAPRIHKGLEAARKAFQAGERDTDKLLAAARKPIEECPLMRIDYLEARSLETLEELKEAKAGDTLIAAAVFLGSTRLIDNIRL